MWNIAVYFVMFFINLSVNLICLVALFQKRLLEQNLNWYLVVQMTMEIIYSLVYLIEFLLFLYNNSLEHLSPMACLLQNFTIESINTLSVYVTLIFTLGHLYTSARSSAEASECFVFRRPIIVSVLAYLAILITQSPSLFLVKRAYHKETAECYIIESIDHQVFLSSVFMNAPPIGLTLVVQLIIWFFICNCKCIQSLRQHHDTLTTSILPSPSSNNLDDSTTTSPVTPKSRSIDTTASSLDLYTMSNKSAAAAVASSFQAPLRMLMFLNYICLFHFIYNLIHLWERLALIITGIKHTLILDSRAQLIINAVCIMMRTSYLFVYIAFHKEFRFALQSKCRFVFKMRRHSSNSARYTPASDSLTQSLEIIID